jgi:hypothetical protein
MLGTCTIQMWQGFLFPLEPHGATFCDRDFGCQQKQLLDPYGRLVFSNTAAENLLPFAGPVNIVGSVS